MKIQEKINQDLKAAMLAKDEASKSLLRVIIGEFNRIGKDLTDEQAISVLKKMYQNAIDLKNVEEQNIISQYLPKQLTESELKDIIVNLINTNSSTKKDIGQLMGFLKASYGGQYDGKLASQLIKTLLP